jgi:hypothetical protein
MLRGPTPAGGAAGARPRPHQPGDVAGECLRARRRRTVRAAPAQWPGAVRPSCVGTAGSVRPWLLPRSWHVYKLAEEVLQLQLRGSPAALQQPNLLAGCEDIPERGSVSRSRVAGQDAVGLSSDSTHPQLRCCGSRGSQPVQRLPLHFPFRAWVLSWAAWQ